MMAEDGVLRMRRSTLLGLPEGRVPRGYTLWEPEPARDAAYRALCEDRFNWPGFPFEREMTGAFGYTPEGVTVLRRAGGIAAAAAALMGTREEPRLGTLHYVAVAREEEGRGLGYAVCLLCLHKMAAAGMEACMLYTHDFRLPALATYRRLGFAIDPTDEAMAQRWEAARERLDTWKRP